MEHRAALPEPVGAANHLLNRERLKFLQFRRCKAAQTAGIAGRDQLKQRANIGCEDFQLRPRPGPDSQSGRVRLPGGVLIDGGQPSLKPREVVRLCEERRTNKRNRRA